MRRSASFRVGRVRANLRGQICYLSYFEHGRRRQPRVGPDRQAARERAAEVNAHLEAGAPSALGFEPIGFSELRQRWLDNHEYVRRSSLETVRRYQTATQPGHGSVQPPPLDLTQKNKAAGEALTVKKALAGPAHGLRDPRIRLFILLAHLKMAPRGGQDNPQSPPFSRSAIK